MSITKKFLNYQLIKKTCGVAAKQGITRDPNQILFWNTKRDLPPHAPAPPGIMVGLLAMWLTYVLFLLPVGLPISISKLYKWSLKKSCLLICDKIEKISIPIFFGCSSYSFISRDSSTILLSTYTLLKGKCFPELNIRGALQLK